MRKTKTRKERMMTRQGEMKRKTRTRGKQEERMTR